MGFRLGAMSLRNLFTKPVTKMYPEVQPQFPPALKGEIANDIKLCIFCSTCVVKCPADALKVDKTAGTWAIDRFACVQCGSCVRACPKKCLSMEVRLPKPATQMSELVMHRPEPEPEVKAA
ncbi:MAG: 4Fe-4S binding protein [Coriobacteriales bacterium]|jgi:formate hydrogenlyase subunit 6/NADH:ubiquinone oxidoreductase subunit I|nr:4Fe-4S binding protein [Coriobacteriales bacterium]